jgi:hypothetical protein
MDANLVLFNVLVVDLKINVTLVFPDINLTLKDNVKKLKM